MLLTFLHIIKYTYIIYFITIYNVSYILHKYIILKNVIKLIIYYMLNIFLFTKNI